MPEMAHFRPILQKKFPEGACPRTPLGVTRIMDLPVLTPVLGEVSVFTKFLFPDPCSGLCNHKVL